MCTADLQQFFLVKIWTNVNFDTMTKMQKQRSTETFPLWLPTTNVHGYSVTIQNAMSFDLQVKNIDFRFSSKSGASGIILFENITFNGQMRCFMTVSSILNCYCCNTFL